MDYTVRTLEIHEAMGSVSQQMSAVRQVALMVDQNDDSFHEVKTDH